MWLSPGQADRAEEDALPGVVDTQVTLVVPGVGLPGPPPAVIVGSSAELALVLGFC